ncbi:MAG: VCBS domain-containing protein [Candidatus Endonucleobacter sp. (ex Gigantidas childressi)]|nr:VCBS domain-containing protein [Candidatus Endonucleobacter sp. (ex Gigantidas childressi)]
MNSNGNYVVIGHISEDSEPVEVISVDGSIRIVNAGEPVFVGETVLNSYDFPIKISLINNKSILVGLQQERLMEMSDLDDAGISSIDYSNGIDQPVDDFSTNDSSDKDKVLAEEDRLASQSMIERSDKDVDEVFYKSNRVVGIDERQFTKEHVIDDIPAIPANNPPIIQSQGFTVRDGVLSDGSFTVGSVKVIDLDESQSHIYAIVGGNNDGCFAINPATGDITVVGEIDYENIDSYDLSIKVTDNGIPPLTTFKTITIDIEDVNEAPVANPDVATSGENGSLIINVLANDTDVDSNDNPSSYILLSTDIIDTNGDILVGMGEVSISNNQVLFALGSDFDYLGDGEVMDLLIRYQMSDSGGLTSNSFLSITITGTNDQPVIDLINASGTLAESNSTTGLSTTGTLSFTELDSGEIVTVSKSDTSITWNGGDLTSSLSTTLMEGFVISNSGWSYSTSANLDFLGKDQTIVLKYNVTATDDSGTANAASAGKEVIVTITGTNDQPVIDSITGTGALTEGDGAVSLATTGLLSFTELDSGDVVTISEVNTDTVLSDGTFANLETSLKTALIGGFSVTNDGWSYSTDANLDFLGKDQTITLKYNVTATDNSGAANAESVEKEVTIVITGTNDQPVIDSITGTGALTEGDGAASLATTGLLSFTELDSGDVVTISEVNTDTVLSDGTFANLDTSLKTALIDGFSVTSGGWSYSTDANLDFLRAGQTITLKYNVTATDNSGAANAESAEKEVTIVITGTNDQPVIDSITGTGALTEGDGAASLATTGLLSFTELDSGDVVTISEVNTDTVLSDGTFANLETSLKTALIDGFSVTNDGWSYSTDANLDFLRAGQTITLKYNVTATDDSGAANAASAGKEVIVTITGTNDQPVIDSITGTGALTEGDGAASLATTGLLSFTELDSGDVVTISEVNTDTVLSDGTFANLDTSLKTALIDGFSVTSGGWSYSTDANLDFLGKDQTITLKYNVTATDNSGAANAESVEKEVTIVITGTNDAPVASVNDTISTFTGVVIDALATVYDVDDNKEDLTLDSATIVDGDGNSVMGSGVVNIVDNRLIFNPGNDFSHLGINGTEQVTIRYKVLDDSGASDISTIVITVKQFRKIISKSELAAGSLFDGDIDAPVSEDITQIKMVFAGDGLNTSNDKVVLGADISLSSTIATTSVDSSFSVAGLSYSYDSGTKTLIITKSDGAAISGSDIETIIESIRLKNTDSEANEGERAITISYIDEAGNEGVSATAIITVSGLGIVGIRVSGLPDGEGVFGEGDVVTLTLTVNQVLTLGGGAEGTVMIGGKAFALDSSASAAAGNNKLVFTYTVADGDVISEENFKIDNPSTDVSLIDISSANGTAVVFSNETPKFFLSKEIVFGSNLAVTVTDGTKGKTLESTGESNWGSSGVFSDEGFVGDAKLGFKMADETSAFMLGFSSDNTNHHYNSIDYALYVSNTTAQIYNSGSLLYSYPDDVAAGDEFIVERNGTDINYYHISSATGALTLLYTTSNVDITTRLFVDSSLRDSGSKVVDVNLVVESDFAVFVSKEMVFGSNLAVTVTDGTNGKNLESTGSDGWDNSGVFSDEGFIGDARLGFKLTDVTSTFMLGFSSDNPNHDYATVEYAIYISDTGGIQAYNDGSSDGASSVVAEAGDEFIVERHGADINYYHISSATGAVTLIHTTSNVDMTTRLFVDSAFYLNGSKVVDVNLVLASKVAVDTVAPDAVDLSVSDGVQATSLNGAGRTLLAEGVKFNSDIAIPESNDITQIKIVFAGDSLDTSNDKVVLGADISLNATIATTSVDNSFAVAGLSYSYDAGTKTLIITKTDGKVIYGSDIETIVESIELKNTHSDANEGERTVEISYLDGGGNESVSAIATIMVGPSIINVVVSNIPDGRKAFIEGDVITLTLTVDQVLTLGGGAEGTVMIAGKTFALDSSASAAAGNNKLVFTYTVADGDIISEENFKIDNPGTDVSLIDISSANGNAVVSNNETPKLFLHREMVFGSNLAVTVTDGTNGKTLESTGSDAWGNSGVFSDEGFIGDGRLSFKLADVTSRFMLGFSSDNPNHSYTTMEYAIYISNTGIQIYTDNSNDAQSSVVAEAGDEFIVERHGTDINYYHISSATGAVTLIHTTSNVDITTRLFVDSAFHSNGSKVVDVNLVAESDSAAFVSKEMVFGSNLAVTVTDGTNGKNLESTGSTAWGNSGVFSDEGFIGDGRLSFKMTGVTDDFMLGFSSDNPNHSYDSIDYAVYVSHTTARIYNSGSILYTYPDDLAVGDEFIVERNGMDINYYHISSATGAVTLIHTTSNVDITIRLFVDSAFYSNGSKVVDVNLVVASKVAVDAVAPDAVDLSVSNGVQATSLNGAGRTLLAEGVKFNSDIAIPESNDITQIKIVFAGDSLDTSNDKVVLGADISLNATIATTSVDNSFAVAGLSYSYDAGTKTLIITKTDGKVISGSDIETIVESIELKNTHSDANEGERTVEISYLDGVGNESVSAIATIMVGPSIINVVVSNIPDGRKAFIEGDVITLTLTVDQALTLGGGAEGTVMIGGKTFALDSSASAAAGDNKLVFTYTVADGDIISEENSKIDNPSTDVSLTNVSSSANGNAVVFNNETPDLLGIRDMTYSDYAGMSVSDGVGGKTFEKTAANGWGNAGVFSDEGFVGDGYLSFKTTDTTSAFMLGFSVGASSDSDNTIDYALYVNATTIHVYQSDSWDGKYSDFIAEYPDLINEIGDTYKVERDGTNINYYHTSRSTGVVTLFFTQTGVSATSELFIEGSFYSLGAKPEGVHVVSKNTFAVDAVAPDAVDLSVSDGVQATSLNGAGRTLLAEGVKFNSDIAIPESNDITQIKIVFAGDSLDTSNDKVVLGADISLNATIATTSVDNSFAVAGLSYSYDAGTKTLIITKTDGTVISGSDIETIVESIELKNTHSDANEGERTVEISYLDGVGNESVSAIATIMVGPSIINMVVSNIPDGRKAFIEGDVITLTLTVDQALTLGGGAEGTVMIGGKTFALDSSASAAAGDNKLVFTYTVADGDIISEENFKIDNPSTDVSLIDISSANGNAVVFGNEIPKFFLPKEMVFGSNLAVTVTDGTNGKNLESTGSTAWGNSGVFSDEGFIGDARLSFKLTDVTYNFMLGFSSDNPDHNYATVEYALHIISTGIQIYTDGSRDAVSSVVSEAGDEFIVERNGTDINYYHISSATGAVTLIHTTSNVDITTRLFVDSAFYSNGAKIVDVNLVVESDFDVFVSKELVFGSNLAVTVSDGTNGKNLESTGSIAWNNSGVFSDEGFIGDARLSFKLADVTSIFLLGFSSDNPNHDYTTVEYALYISGTSIGIFIDGSHDAHGSVASEAGDEFIVERHGTDINYYHISSATGAVTLIHTTSNVDITTRLFVDSAFYSNGAKVVDVNLVVASKVAVDAVAPDAVDLLTNDEASPVLESHLVDIQGPLINIALASNDLATYSAPGMTYHVDGSKLDISRAFDANINTTLVDDYQVHPTNADGKYFLIDFKNVDYSQGVFRIHNRVNGGLEDRINGSVLEFLKDGEVVVSHTIAGAENDNDDIYEYTPANNIVFDQVKLTFSGDNQNFREIEVFGKEYHENKVTLNYSKELANIPLDISEFTIKVDDYSRTVTSVEVENSKVIVKFDGSVIEGGEDVMVGYNGSTVQDDIGNLAGNITNHFVVGYNYNTTEDSEVLNGSVGSDLFSINHNDVSIFGGDGADTFDFNTSVSSGSIANFAISDFNIDEGDVLLLDDLIINEDNSLDQLLDFSVSANNTVVNVRDVAGGDVTRQVTLDNVDLSAYGNTDAEIINKLLDDGNLQIDS